MDSEKSRGQTCISLANLPVGTIVDEAALAAALNVSPRTLRRMVSRGEVPPGIKLGARKVWLSERVLTHFAERAERAVAEAERLAVRIGRPF